MSQPWNTGGDGQQPAEQYPQYGPGPVDGSGTAENPYGSAGSVGVGYPYGYPQAFGGSPALVRPGSVTATAVLAFVQAGLVLFGALGAFAGGQVLQDDFFTSSTNNMGAWLIVLGVAGLLVGGLLIAGGVQVVGGKPMLVRVANYGSLALSVAWAFTLVIPTGSDATGVFWAVVFAVMPIIGLSLLATEPSKRWLSAKN